MHTVISNKPALSYQRFLEISEPHYDERYQNYRGIRCLGYAFDIDIMKEIIDYYNMNGNIDKFSLKSGEPLTPLDRIVYYQIIDLMLEGCER